MYELHPEAPVSITSMTQSFVADELDELAIGSILGHLEESSLPSTEALAAVEPRVLGGAISRIRSTPPPCPPAAQAGLLGVRDQAAP
jgi:hypothetical protein